MLTSNPLPTTADVAVERPGSVGWLTPQRVAVLAVLVGIIVRLLFLMTPAGGLDGDEAVTGIMANRMAEGQDFYLFFLGQHYNSAIEQYLQAALFWVGIPQSSFTLRLPQVALGATSIWLIYRVGLRMLKTPWHAAFAALLFSVGPYFLIWKGTRSAGSYVAQLVVILVGLLCALRLDQGSSRPRLDAALVGLCVGGTYWLTPAGYYVMLPCALWFGARARRDIKAVASAAGGFVVGLIPIIYWTLATGEFPTPNPGIMPSTAADRLGNLVDEVGREFLGLAHLGGAPGWPIPLARGVLWLVVLAVAVGLVRRWRGVLALLTLREAERKPVDILLLSAVVTVGAYAASPYAWFITEPRYLFTAFPVLILGLAHLIPRAGAAAAAGALVIFGVFGGSSLVMLVNHADDAPASRDADLRQAIRLLERENTLDVYGEYWTAMPLKFLAGDRLRVGSTVAPERLLEDRRLVDASSDPVWIASAGVNTDDRDLLRTALKNRGVSFRERSVGRTVVLFDELSPRVRPWEVGLGVPPPPSPD